MCPAAFTARKQKIRKSSVPWRYPEEFIKVYNYLFANDITKKRWAVDQIAVWDTRCYPSLPRAIEASVVITRCMIQDVLLTSGATLCQESEIQLLYSMALIRFVNSVIEAHQSVDGKGSVGIALNLGVATWVVDLRNMASHSATPSIGSLRLAANEAMKYLHDSFWKIEVDRYRSVMKTAPDNDFIKAELGLYRILQWKRFTGKFAKQEEKANDFIKLKLVLKRLDYLLKNKRPFLEVLVSDNFMVISEEDMRLLLQEKELASLLYAEQYMDEDDDFEGSMPTSFILPPTLEKMWAPILSKLNFVTFTDLVEALLLTQQREEVAKQKLVAAWIIRILRVGLNPKMYKSPLSIIFQRRNPMFQWDRLWHAALATPSQFTVYIYPLIVGHLNIGKQALQKQLHLLAISQGQALEPKKSYKQNTAFTLENLKKARKRQKMELKKRRNVEDETDGNVFADVPENFDYESVPIGFVFNSSKESDSAEQTNLLLDFPEEDFRPKQFIFGNVNEEEIESLSEEDPDEADKHTLRTRKSFWFMN